MRIWELLEVAVRKCGWLHSKFIHKHKTKCKFGNYLIKLNVNFDLDYNSMHQELLQEDYDELLRLFMLWLSDISDYEGKRIFLKESGGKGRVENRGNLRICELE